MDGNNFDRFTRSLAHGTDRRRLLRGVLAGLAGAVGVGAAGAAGAKDTKCYGTGSKCSKGTDCCSRTCTNRVCAGGTGGSCVCPDDGNPCTTELCDAAGQCVHPSLPDGTRCGASGLCAGGVCRPCAATVCPYPTTGYSTCVNLGTDEGHCGQCGAACAAGEVCLSGSCCPVGSTALCGGVCVDTTTDPDNCGDCRTVCPDDTFACTSPICVNGFCSTGFDNSVCDDGNRCTQDLCSPYGGDGPVDAKGCAHPPISCNDGNGCTVDTCDPVVGCVHTPVTCPPGQFCVDHSDLGPRCYVNCGGTTCDVSDGSSSFCCQAGTQQFCCLGRLHSGCDETGCLRREF